MKRLAAATLIAVLPIGAWAQCENLGPAGLLAKANSEDLPPITLGSGKPLAEGPLKLKSGTHYEIEIISDGSAELALAGPEFFRAIWVNEVVINDIEVRPMALDSFEFDDEGTLAFDFIAIKPGQYYLKIPGSTGESQRVEITIE
ncbi:MAG TPA: hypothetical protein VFR34_08110 [Paracoccaceae bacterium]|nr:hypothetical protein [Paracoccaceae bacterium]